MTRYDPRQFATAPDGSFYCPSCGIRHVNATVCPDPWVKAEATLAIATAKAELADMQKQVAALGVS